jgi:hypothetical protein
LKRNVKHQVWWLLGWYSALLFACNVVGIVGWNLFLRNNLQSGLFGKEGYRQTDRLFYETFSSFHFGTAVRFIVYGLEIACCCVASLMPLERLLHHVVRGMHIEVEARGQQLPWYVADALRSCFLSQIAFVQCHSSSLSGTAKAGLPEDSWSFSWLSAASEA